MTAVTTWEPLTVEVDEFQPQQVRVTVRGELDVLNNARFREALRELYGRSQLRVAVDLTEARVRDSAALVTLVAARRRLAARGGTLTLRGLTPLTRQIFARAGLGRMFPLEVA